jgi:hypothetical protein
MKTTGVSRLVQVVVAILLSATLLIPGFVPFSTAQDEAIFNSPLPTPPVPSPTPLPSAEAQVALRYIAERYGVPVEQLAIVNEHRREYAELGRAFQAFTLLDLANDRFFNLLVDLEDHTVVEDVAAIQRAEEDAYRQEYGKLDPALYERLQQAADDEAIEVAIWIAGRPRRSQQELFAELATMFPEAQAAMERSGKPFDVQDPGVRARIEQAYDAIAKVDTQPLVQPVVDFLQAQRYTVTTYDGLPSVTVVLPKRVILALAERPDVGRIFLIEGEGELLLDSAVPTDRVPVVWQRGFEGTGRSIAILETDNVDFTSNSQDCPAGTHNCFRHPGVTRPGTAGEFWHASLVASSAASDHGSHKGMAPDATIHSAGMTANTEAGFVDGLKWALGSAGVSADVVNVSWGRGYQRDMR